MSVDSFAVEGRNRGFEGDGTKCGQSECPGIDSDPQGAVSVYTGGVRRTGPIYSELNGHRGCIVLASTSEFKAPFRGES